MAKTIDDRRRFVDMRARGYSFQKISEEISVSKPTLIAWAKESSVATDVQNLRAVYMDELQEQHAVTRRHRLATFGGMLSRVKAELEERDLSEVSTDKLVTMAIKLGDALRRDELELELHDEPMFPGLDLIQMMHRKL